MAPLMASVHLKHTISSHSHDYDILATSIACTIIMFVFLGMRLVSRRIKRTPFDWDDAMLVASGIIALGQNILYAWASSYCNLSHDVTIWKPKDIVCVQKGLVAFTIIQPSSLALAKLSLLYLLNKVFHVTRFHHVIRLLMAIVIMWWVGAAFAGLFVCWPINSRWNPNVKGHCGNQELLLVATPIPWVVTDFAILIAPMFVVGKLQLSLGKRAAVMGMFAIGGITCVVTCIRYVQVLNTRLGNTLNYSPLAVWSMAESSITISCVSFIASKPVLKSLVPQNLISRSTSWLKQLLPRKESKDHPHIKQSKIHLRTFVTSSQRIEDVVSGRMHPIQDNSERSSQAQTKHPLASSSSDLGSSGVYMEGSTFNFPTTSEDHIILHTNL